MSRFNDKNYYGSFIEVTQKDKKKSVVRRIVQVTQIEGIMETYDGKTIIYLKKSGSWLDRLFGNSIGFVCEESFAEIRARLQCAADIYPEANICGEVAKC